jgi:hypothetical protein
MGLKLTRGFRLGGDSGGVRRYARPAKTKPDIDVLSRGERFLFLSVQSL